MKRVRRPGSQTNPWNRETPHSLAGMWFNSRVCLRAINRKITGDPDLPWFDYVLDTHHGSGSRSCGGRSVPRTVDIFGFLQVGTGTADVVGAGTATYFPFGSSGTNTLSPGP